MDYIFQDIKFGFRQMFKHPVFTLTAVVALGLGIGSVSTQFSVMNGIFIKGLPLPEAEDLAHLERINVERDAYSRDVPIPEFLEWEERQDSFDGLAGFYTGTANFTVDESVNRFDGCFMTPNCFELMKVDAVLGRTLLPSDNAPDSPHVVVLSHKAWVTHYAENADIVGTAAVLNGRSVTIVGVMPEGFGFPANEDLWIPLFNQQKREEMIVGEPAMNINVMGKLKEGVSFDMAQSNMAVIAQQMEKTYPVDLKGFRDVNVRPFKEMYLGGETKPLMAVMFLITILILIIACANVANLLLARSMRRQKEVAIRSALGASRNRIISQFLTESILIAVLGSILAVILAMFDTQDLNNALVELDAPFWMDFTFDWTVMLTVACITIATGILSGIVPAYKASRLNQNEILKDDTRTSSSLHMGMFSKLLVVVQISVAAVILTLVVLFSKSVSNRLNLDYAYDAEGVMTARIGLFEDSYPTEQQRANMIQSLLVNLEARPEVKSAASTNRYQFLEGYGITYEMPGRIYAAESDREFCRYQYVSEGFLETMQLPLIIGESFKPEDFLGTSPRKVIINKALAEREWPGMNPIGQQFKPSFFIKDVEFEDLPIVEVIGVVGDMQEAGVLNDSNEDGAAILAPQTVATMPGFITILVRPNGKPDEMISVIREELRKLDNNLPIYMVGTPKELNDQALFQLDFFNSIFREFGILATILAAVGIYGVITFSVNQRIMEFGIRQALGATRLAVIKLVFSHAIKQLSLGFLLALLLLSPVILMPGVRESMAIFFYKIDPNSLTPYLWSFGFVTIISILAATPPALKAARIQPAQALRYE